MNSASLRVLIAFDGSPSAMAVASCWSSWESERVSLKASLLTITPCHAASAGNAAACSPLADKLTTAKAWFSKAGLTLESVVVDGEKPAKKIIEEAQHRKADLIAMGTRGLSPLRGLLLGSVAAEVASHSPIPIWLMGPNAAMPAALGRVLQLLVAIDGSKQAAHSANWAGRMAQYLGETSIELFSVQPAFSPFEGMLDAAAGNFHHWGQGLGEAAIEAATQQMGAAGHRVTATIATGDTVPMILARADGVGADVIVVAPHSANVLEQAVLGSVSQSLLQVARCPVLIVPRNRECPNLV